MNSDLIHMKHFRFKKAYFRVAGNSCEKNVEREMRICKQTTAAAVIGSADNGSELPSPSVEINHSSPKPTFFQVVHKEIVAKRNAERRGGASDSANFILTMREYHDFPLILEGDPLQWWSAKFNEGMMVSMMDVIKKLFCVPATSVPAEQLFSKAGLLISEKRNRLNPTNVDILLFLNKNA